MKSTRIAFRLSMPGVGSWNGKWSGKSRNYVVVRAFRNREAAEKILSKGGFSYRWSDGWAARVGVSEVDAAEARSLKKKSNGFCGYDWMIDRIISHGQILADHELPAKDGEAEAIRSAFAALRELADRCGVELEMEAVR